MATAIGPSLGEVSDVSPLLGEKNSGGNPAALLSSLVLESAGDLMWWRPDAWRMAREPAMAKLVAEAVATGRRSRAIYPNIALQEAPAALKLAGPGGRADPGGGRAAEPTPDRRRPRMAVLPEPLGATDEPRLLVRQTALWWRPSRCSSS